MPSTSKIALNAGELSDEIAGRIDLSKFNTGCEILENARVLRAGGVSRRAGMKFVSQAMLPDRKTRVQGFRFSELQGYVIELSHFRMRVLRGGEVDSTEYDTPWSEDQIFQLQFAQRIDRIIVTHPNVPVHNIIRFNDGTWGVSEIPWSERVWEPHPTIEEVILTSNRTSGNATIVASTNVFEPSWVGDRIRIEHTVGEVTTEYTNSTARVGQLLVPATTVQSGWTFETFGTWDGEVRVQRSYNNGTTWDTIKVIISNNDRNELVTETENQPALIRVQTVSYSGSADRTLFTVNSYQSSGVALVTSYISPTSVGTTIERPFESTQPSTIWFEEAFSPRNGYPAGVTFYQSRLCFGGTQSRPQTIWLSKTQAPFDFTRSTLATGAMSFETDAEGYESVTWLSSHLSLLVGTTLGVWAISAPDGSSLTPENNNILRQMEIGAQAGFQGIQLQNNVLFLQYKGRKIQELTGGSVEYGGYLASDLTQLATHVTREGVTQMVAGQLPDSSLFMINGGEVSILTYERSQNVVGWSRWKTNGAFESVATTSGAGEDDDHYFVIERNGRRCIEFLTPDMLRIEEDNDVPNLRFLDGYVEKVQDEPFRTMDGLDHLNGMEVQLFIDGEPQGEAVVDGGVVTLPRDARNAVVGLRYDTVIRPMPLDFGAIGSKSSISEVVIRFRNTLGGETSQDGVLWSLVEQIQPRITSGDPLPLQSLDYQSTPHSTWARRSSISIRQTQPLPMTVLAVRIQSKTTR